MERIIVLTVVCCIAGMHAFSQVPVREEPRHKPVIVNQYFRMMDVHISPGDTTLFHIHETPSLFLRFTNTYVKSQLKGMAWSEKENSQAGSVSYEEFSTARIHRVSNVDSDIFHVTDIEIMSSYHPADGRKPLPFNVVLENEKAIAYRIVAINSEEHINNRGPIIAALVEGDLIEIKEKDIKGKMKISNGKFIYLKPGGSYTLASRSKEKIDLVLFELK